VKVSSSYIDVAVKAGHDHIAKRQSQHREIFPDD
jgi:hypothetical protein